MIPASDLTEGFLEAFLPMYQTDSLAKYEAIYPGIADAVCQLHHKRKQKQWEDRQREKARERLDLAHRWSRYTVTIKNTANRRRASLAEFHCTHRGHYSRLMYLKESRAKSERFKHSRWTMFTASVIQYRMQSVTGWLPDPKHEAEGVAQQLWNQPLDEPYTNLRWPWGSACLISPQHTQDWLDLQELKTKTFEIENRQAKMRRILMKLMDRSEDNDS